MDCKHYLKIVETEHCYFVYLDGKELDNVTGIKIEREIKPRKEDELNKIIIKYDEYPNGRGKMPVVEKELILEGAKLEFS